MWTAAALAEPCRVSEQLQTLPHAHTPSSDLHTVSTLRLQFQQKMLKKDSGVWYSQLGLVGCQQTLFHAHTSLPDLQRASNQHPQ